MIAGVCGGVGEYFALDPVLVRIAFVVLAVSGPGVLLYVVAWILLPEAESGTATRPSAPAQRRNEGAFLFGVILVAVGGLILVAQFAPAVHRFFWPAALITLGVLVMAGGLRRDRT